MKPLVRVTQLEQFRRYLSDEYAYATEQSVIDSITGEFQGNEQTRIGTAFHSIVETGQPECVKIPQGQRTFLYRGKQQTEPVPCGRVFDIDGFPVTLDIPQIKVALAYRDEHPDAIHEYREYADYGDAVVTGCADMIDGFEIRDIKTKFSFPSDGDYINSCQARFYMEMFGADTFHFDLFIFDGYDRDKHGYDVRGLPLLRHTPPITVYWEHRFREDNRRLLSGFLEWAESKGITNHLMKEHI